MVYTGDLKSPDLGHEGSSPSSRTSPSDESLMDETTINARLDSVAASARGKIVVKDTPLELSVYRVRGFKPVSILVIDGC